MVYHDDSHVHVDLACEQAPEWGFYASEASGVRERSERKSGAWVLPLRPRSSARFARVKTPLGSLFAG